MAKQKIARWLGIDITTTEMALAVSDGSEDGFASLKMRGATLWRDDPKCPAFQLSEVPGMLSDLLDQLADWDFQTPGSLSVACRQHDMVVLDAAGEPLLPALSWQCNAAEKEVAELNRQDSVTDSVGRVEERFILPKLMYVLRTEPELRDRVHQVMTTGDWVLGMLTGSFGLSTSDALSNGLLDQQTRTLPTAVLQAADLRPEWFPTVIQSGHSVGRVVPSQHAAWSPVSSRLAEWQAVAGLGDNHASALGCGMQNDRTMVISAGTSGTVNLACPATSQLTAVENPAARFEFYREQSLLLRMLPFCGDWYNRFLATYCPDIASDHEQLNNLALSVEPEHVQRVPCGNQGEEYPAGWDEVPQAAQVASVQYSIAAELLLHVRELLRELPTARESLERYVLTGGLSQSPFFQQVFSAGISVLDPGKSVHVSGRTGPLRYKTSASGALCNARMPEWDHDLRNMPQELFPLAPCRSDGHPALVEKLRVES